MASVTVTNDGDIVLGNLVLKDKLAKAAGKGDNYTDNLTVEELGAITGPIDLSDNGPFLYRFAGHALPDRGVGHRPFRQHRFYIDPKHGHL